MLVDQVVVTFSTRTPHQYDRSSDGFWYLGIESTRPIEQFMQVGMMTLIFCGVDSVRRWSDGWNLRVVVPPRSGRWCRWCYQMLSFMEAETIGSYWLNCVR